jgi:iron(II)-dependent oxidoreductase
VGTASIRSGTGEKLLALLEEARERTLALVAPLSDDDMRAQHDPLMSPILWDMGHIAHFEELWLTQNLDGVDSFRRDAGMYNPFEHHDGCVVSWSTRVSTSAGRSWPRSASVSQPSSSPSTGAPMRPSCATATWVHMVLQHEYQHNETMLQTLQLKRGAPYPAPRRFYRSGSSNTSGVGAMARFGVAR